MWLTILGAMAVLLVRQSWRSPVFSFVLAADVCIPVVKRFGRTPVPLGT